MSRKSQRSRSRRQTGDVVPIDRTLASALACVAGIGLVISVFLTYVHVRLELQPTWQSACAIDATVNCDAVVSSPFGSIGGIPISLIAAWFYGVAGWTSLVGLRGGLRRIPRSPAVILVAQGILAVGVSLVLGVVSAVILRVLCVLCAALYVINGALLGVAWIALRRTGEPLRDAIAAERAQIRAHPIEVARWAIGASLALVIPVVAVLIVANARSAVCQEVSAAAKGKAPSPVVLVVYSDFQCPRCRALNTTLQAIRGNPHVKVAHRHFPLEGLCNPRVHSARHAGACLQARAAICASIQGRETELADRLFESGDPERDKVVALAIAVGLEARSFEECLDSEATAASLRRDVDAAIAAGVRSTPTVFVNDRRLVGEFTPNDIACLSGERPTAGDL